MNYIMCVEDDGMYHFCAPIVKRRELKGDCASSFLILNIKDVTKKIITYSELPGPSYDFILHLNVYNNHYNVISDASVFYYDQGGILKSASIDKIKFIYLNEDLLRTVFFFKTMRIKYKLFHEILEYIVNLKRFFFLSKKHIGLHIYYFAKIREGLAKLIKLIAYATSNANLFTSLSSDYKTTVKMLKNNLDEDAYSYLIEQNYMGDVIFKHSGRKALFLFPKKDAFARFSEKFQNYIEELNDV
jgi:hypothetical protein